MSKPSLKEIHEPLIELSQRHEEDLAKGVPLVVIRPLQGHIWGHMAKPGYIPKQHLNTDSHLDDLTVDVWEAHHHLTYSLPWSLSLRCFAAVLVSSLAEVSLRSNPHFQCLYHQWFPHIYNSYFESFVSVSLVSVVPLWAVVPPGVFGGSSTAI